MALRISLHIARYILMLMLLLPQAFVLRANQLDSLKRALEQSASDTARYNLLIKIGQAYRDSSYTKALYYYKQSLDVVEHTRYKLLQANSYHKIGSVYHLQGEVNLALDNMSNAMAIYDALDDDARMAEVSNNIGVIYKDKGKYDVSTHYLLRALRLYEKTNDVEGIAKVSNNLGQVQYYMRNFSSAIEHFTHYYDVNQQLGNPRAMAGAANNIASAYLEMGEFDKSIDYYFAALGIYDSLGFRLGQAVILDNMGSLFYEIARYDEAIKHHQKAIAIFEELQSAARLATSKIYLARVYLKQHQLDLAIAELNAAHSMVEPLGRIDLLRDVFLLLAEAHEMGHSYQQAYSFLKEHKMLNDSIVGTETLQNIERIRAEHEAEKRKRTEETASRMLNLNRWLVLVVTVALLVVLVLLATMHRNYKLQRGNTAQVGQLNGALIDSIGQLLSTSPQQLVASPSPFAESWCLAPPPQGASLPKLILRCQTLQGHTLMPYVVLQRSAKAVIELVDLSVSQFLAQLPSEPDMEHIDLRLRRHLASSALTAQLTSADYSIWPFAVRGGSVLSPVQGMVLAYADGKITPLPAGQRYALAPESQLYVYVTAEDSPSDDFMKLLHTLVQYPFEQQHGIASNSLSIVEMNRTSLICALRVGPNTNPNHQLV